MSSAPTLSSLIALLYDAALDPDRWHAFLEAFADVSGATGAVLLHHDLQNPRGLIAASVRIDPESLRLYDQYFGARDPWIAGARSRGVLVAGAVHIGEELIAHDQLQRTEYYSDLAKPFGLTRVLSAAIRQDDLVVSSVSALRPDSRSPFGEGERALLRHLMPHLQRGLQVHRRIAGLDLLNQAALNAFDHLSNALILVREDATIIFANRAAERILRAGDGLTVTKQALTAALPSESRRLRLLIRAAAQISTGQGNGSNGAMTLSRSSFHRPLAVLVAPLRVPLRNTLVPVEVTSPAAVVFVSDPDQVIPTDVGTLRTLWNLTPTEAAIAILLGSGRNLREIAERRSITLSTIRWHVKRILLKTHTRTQAECVRLLTMGLPSVLAPEPRDRGTP